MPDAASEEFFRNIGVDGLDLFFNYNPMINDHLGRALAEIRLMTRHLGDLDLNAGMLVCEITEQAADDHVLAPLVREMRRHGIRIAIDDFGTGPFDRGADEPASNRIS